jgi:uncharacterized cupredoxin-like copper-binding protein
MDTKSTTGAAVMCLLAGFSAHTLAHGDAHDAPPGKQAVAPEITSFGQSGDPRKVTRTITVAMDDTFRYTPSKITIKKGETVRIVAHNKGKLLHEIVIGSPAELQAHAELMRKFPTMEHEAAHMAHVPPGKREEIVWQFTQAGEFKFGCLVAGHFEAGMVGDISVQQSATVVPPSAAAPRVEGEVRRVDKDQGKITLKHGPIPNLEMPGMTMVFRVRDPSMLGQVQAGDKVRFTADNVGGQVTITSMEISK